MHTDTVSAAARPLTLRKRPDLIVAAQRFGGRNMLAIKDPLTLRYYHLGEEEYFVLQQLNGRTSAEQVQAAFERRFSPRKLPLASIEGFLGMLHRENLVVADAPDQDRTLLERRRESRRRRRLTAWSNPLAIRFRGIDPERLLSWLYPRVRWVFAPWFLVASLLLMLAAAGWLSVQFSSLVSRLPTFQAFFNPANLIWFGAAIAAAKIVHELAHALACKHFGGECHELGVMLLVFTPCLFVNVSDSWMLPDRRQRMAIAAAGIWAELTLAAICAFLWWFSGPGLLNSICLKLMFVSSLGTVLFNANPLLPYDGYYVLADLWEMPNLRDRSWQLLRKRFAQWLLGVEPGDEGIYPERGQAWLLFYAIASLLYRLLVVAAILWFCHLVLRPHGLQVLAQLLTVLVVAGLLAGPAWKAWRFWTNPAWRRQVKSSRALVRAATLAVAAVVLLAVPLPSRVHVPVVIEPQGARRVFVTTPGLLRWAIAPESRVRIGDRLAELENIQLMRDLAALQGRRGVLETELENLRRRSALQTNRGAADAGSEIPATEAALADVNRQIGQLQQQQQRLVIRAPRNGTVLPPPSRPDDSFDGALETWHGRPLESRNRGAYLAAGTLLCLIGDPGHVQGVLIVDQSDLPRLRPNQTVYLQLDQLDGGHLEGRTVELAEAPLETIPAELAATRRVPVRTTATGDSQLVGTFYQATVELIQSPAPPIPGGIGRARIVVDPESLGRRIARYLQRTFRLP